MKRYVSFIFLALMVTGAVIAGLFKAPKYVVVIIVFVGFAALAIVERAIKHKGKQHLN